MFYLLVLVILLLLAVAAYISGERGNPLDGTAAFLVQRMFGKRSTDEGTEGDLEYQFEKERLRLLLLVLLVGDILSLFLWISGRKESVIVDGIYIERGAKGEEAKELTLTVKGERGEEADAKVTIEASRYGEEELEALYQDMLVKISEEALLNNPSWEEVTTDLNLMDSMEGYPFTLSWDSDNYYYVLEDGRVADYSEVAELAEQEALVTLRMRAEYYDFEREDVFFARVCPAKEEPDFAGEAEAALTEAERNNPYGVRIRLPREIAGEAVGWQAKKEHTERTIFLLSVACALAVWVLKKKDLQKQAEEMGNSLMAEYPAVISKLTLYLGAGMNLRGAWEKTAKEGKRDEKEQKYKWGNVYTEMLYTCREMDSGIPEAEGYERFGKRIRQQRYIRLTTLLVQNLRKGNAALLTQLKQESYLAMEERTAAARRIGEEMGTKLLLPMMMMMGMVMVLIMVPAFLSF